MYIHAAVDTLGSFSRRCRNRNILPVQRIGKLVDMVEIKRQNKWARDINDLQFDAGYIL